MILVSLLCTGEESWQSKRIHVYDLTPHIERHASQSPLQLPFSERTGRPLKEVCNAQATLSVSDGHVAVATEHGMRSPLPLDGTEAM